MSSATRGAARRTVGLASLVGLAAALVSLARIVTANHDALRTLVWAEDGLFPLCVRNADLVRCAIEPYSGYLLLASRLVAGGVSLAPLDAWPLAANLAAALLAGALCACIVLVLRAHGTGVVATVLVAMLPVALPLIGLESVNSSASVYLILPFVLALLVCLPPRGRFPAVAGGVLAGLAVLTNPTAVLVVLAVAWQAWRGRIDRRSALVVAVVLLAGFVAQMAALLSADMTRSMTPSAGAVKAWADGIPALVMTWWPGQADLTATGTVDSIAATWWAGTGVVLVLAAVVVAVLLLLRGTVASDGVGLMVLTGLLLSLVPTFLGYPNNRYGIPLLLLWSAALLVGIDHVIPASRRWVMGVVAVVVVLLCVPAFPASEFRTTAEPPWPSMLAGVRSACTSDPYATARVTFSPSWPFPDAQFVWPTTNEVPCATVRR